MQKPHKAAGLSVKAVLKVLQREKIYETGRDNTKN
jgi:hypothetical protein